MPMLRNVWELAIGKIGEDTALRSRGAVHNVFIFEHVKNDFAKIIARIQGIEK